jgi:nitrilase
VAKATVAAAQAAYVLMDREATLAKTEALVREAAASGAELVAFPEAFVPGTPFWIDTQRIWDGYDA